MTNKLQTFINKISKFVMLALVLPISFDTVFMPPRILLSYSSGFIEIAKLECFTGVILFGAMMSNTGCLV